MNTGRRRSGFHSHLDLSGAGGPPIRARKKSVIGVGLGGGPGEAGTGLLSTTPPSRRASSASLLSVDVGRTPRRRVSAASIAASVAGHDSRKQPSKVTIWPEWSDADINAEKWDRDAGHKAGKKEPEKGKSPVVQHFFDDPDGKVELPPSVKVSHWKRPQDFITDKVPTITDPDGMSGFDLMTANEFVHESELMRWITSQILALWQSTEVKHQPSDGPEYADGEAVHWWHPWEHIYAINKVGKGPNMPAYNPHGKYVIKLYWLGCWRKIIVDDQIPFDDEDRMLLPASAIQHEIWPMLLTKGLLKVASLDLNGGSSSCEFGDFSVIHCLTGWLPEAIPLQPLYNEIRENLIDLQDEDVDESVRYSGYGHLSEIWNLLKTSLPEWKLPEPDADKTDGDQNKDNTTLDGGKEEKEKENREKAADGKGDKSAKTGKEKAKEDKKGKDKDKDKEKAKEKTILQDELPIPEHPEIIVFASYSGPPKYPVRVAALGEMADASERLRQYGLSHMYPHPVLLNQTRSCPLEPPPPPEIVPAWKLIRPRKKKTTPSDEPQEPVVEKPIQCVGVRSPFINYKVSPVPIPVDVLRPKSSLERGGTRTSTPNVAAIEEGDENAPDPQPQPETAQEEEPPAPPEEPKPEAVEENTTKTKSATSKESLKGRKSSVIKKHEKDQKEGPEVVKDKNSITSKDRRKSASSRDRLDSKSCADVGKGKDLKGSVSSELAVPVPEMETPDGATEHPDTTVFDSEANVEINITEEPAETVKDLWMDFEDFCKCFKTLYIYHKPHTYSCNHKHSDLKGVALTGSKEGKDKKSAPNTGAVMSSSSGTALRAPNAPPNALAGSVPDDRSPHYLFVDNLKPTEIVVSFSSLSHWNEPQLLPTKEDSKGNVKTKEKGGERGESRAETLAAESSSAIETSSGDSRSSESIPQGLLVAEPHSWKSLVTGQPILRLRSTGTRSAVLSLAEGRHVLKFHMQAPLGYHVHLCSTVPFVFGDEEKVMAELTKESCRFVDNAVQVMNCLGKVASAFADPEAQLSAYEQFWTCHCPYQNDKNMSKLNHSKLFNEALYSVLKKALQEAQLATSEMQFAWRAFNFDATTKNFLGIPVGTSRPGTSLGPATLPSDRSSARKANKRRDAQEPKLDRWINREITPEEHVASVKIQKVWRGYWVRKIKAARMPGTEENAKAQEQLLKAWAALEPNAEQHGLSIFRSIFKEDPELMPKYTFYKDEWNKISYADYQGTYQEQTTNIWFVVFREVFYVQEEMLCVPKLYVPIQTCMLRVINNDTGEEIPQVFQKVAPYVYKKNQRGYTFLAEARTTDLPLLPGRWRMRLIGSLSPLPSPTRNEVNASFNTKELRDYYLPNEKNIILRYVIKVTEEHLASLQMTTSKSDVYVKLAVLDNEEEIISAVGKGHVVLPAFMFLKDMDSETESKRSNSRTSQRGSRSKKRGSSAGRVSRSSSQNSHVSAENVTEEEIKPHKYIIQATVLRNSWPLSESSWTFVQMLKEIEKNELKVAFKERPASPQRGDKAGGKGKDKAKAKGGKDKDKGSRPPSQQFDLTKPNWTLRVVSDASAAEDIEVRKDTERADEIRAMKKAWEEAEPGRAAKAMQSRLAYLKSHMIQVEADDDEKAKEEEKTEGISEVGPEGSVSPPPPSGTDVNDGETVLLLEPPPPPKPKEILQPLDLTPFIKHSGAQPRLKDEIEIQHQLEAKQAEIAAYRAYREEVEARRERDRQARNAAKKNQLIMCEQMQAALDAAREAINKPREAFRQKFLEAERKRLEDIAAQEAALRAEQERTAPSPKGRKSAKGKKSPAGKKKK